MSNKTKKSKTATDKLTEAAKQGGILIMAAAATLGMLELPDHTAARAVVVPNQPAFAMASRNIEDQGQASQILRERYEAAPHYISYSVSQRTPSRSSKH
jgi:hypothetical protein